MKKTIALLLAVSSIAVIFPSSVFAEEAKVPEKYTFNANDSFESILNQLHGKKMRASVLLKNGHIYTGRVGAVGSQHVVMESLEGKDFYDASVKISEIVSIEVRVRE